jgi:tetratricopeptide (TPR) repeat protein
MTKLCGDASIESLTQALTLLPQEQLPQMEILLRDFPEDPRLHFLYGSTLISAGRLIEAHRSLTRAVELAPDFAIARFQLGLFQLTSGEPNAALTSFGPLDRLPDTHYLRAYVDGLRCLIRDDFAGTTENLKRGIALNQENLPLNGDMQILIERCQPLLAGTTHEPAETSVSETSLILRQFADRNRLN